MTQMDKIAQAYLGIINPTQQLDEELTPDQKYKADRMRGSGHDFYRERFLEQHPLAKAEFDSQRAKEGKQYRARFPVTITETHGRPEQDVVDHVRNLGYSVDHDLYHRGVATKETTVGNPDAGIPYSVKHVEHKIGGILEKHNAPDEIKKKFINDKFRKGATTKDYDMILTGNHQDIYGASTGRGWTSCATMVSTPKWPKAGSGPAAKCMDEEINNQTHHVYLVPRGGNVDTDAIARTSLKLHKDVLSGHETLMPEGTVHGDAPAAFITHAKALSDRLFEKKPGALYIKNQDVYHDGGKQIVANGPVEPVALDAAWKTTKPKDEHLRATIMSHVNEEGKYSTKGLRDVAKSLKTLKEGVNSGDFVKATEGVWHAHLNIPESAHHHLYEHPVIQDAHEKVPNMFNLHNPEHVKALTGLPKHTGLVQIQNRTMGAIPAAKTIRDYEVLSDLKDRGLHQDHSFSAMIKIDENHDMGKDPMKTIVDHHIANNTLNPETFQRAYQSTYSLKKSKSRGNFYDQAVHFEGEGTPGMSNIVNEIAKRVTTSSNPWSGRPMPRADRDIAITFSHMKPATRQRLADAAGIDHKALMKTHKADIDAEKARYAELRAKVSE